MASKSSDGFLKKLVDTLSSNRFAIYLLIAIAVASLIGVVVPQRYVSIPEPMYHEKFATGVLGFLRALGIFDIFYTWWYRALIGLFLVNLVFCSYKGLVRLLKLRRELEGADFDRLESLARSVRTEKIKADADEKRILEAFRPFGKARRRGEGDGSFWFFEAGALGRFAPYIIHAAVILVVVGGMIGNLFGIDGSVNIPEGGSASKIWLTRGGDEYDLGFVVKCVDFSIEYYEGTGQPKDYKSHLQIFKDGKLVAEKVIEVNDPLEFEGFRFYQASYGLLGRQVEIKAEDTQTGKIYEFAASIGSGFHIDDTGYAFTLVDAKENYQNAGPALNLIVRAPDGSEQSIWIFKESPDFDRLRGGRFVFSYVGDREVYFTGLSVGKNPGIGLIWLGCAIMLIGLVVSFAVVHRWAAVRADGKRLTAAYGASKYRDAWKARFEEAVSTISRGKGK